MANKIDKLTPEQEAQIAVYRAKGLQIGLNTEPTDRLKAIEVIKELYQFIDKPIPNIFIFVRSPFEAQIVANELIVNDDDDAKLNAWNFVENDEWVKNIIGNKSRTKDYKFVATHNYGYGSNETFWVHFYHFFKEQCGIEYPEKSQRGLEIFDKVSQCSGWHYIFDKCAIICDRPVALKMENRVMHCEDGPAIEYADGVKIYVIEGHVLNEQIVMAPETLTLEQIDNEENAETKRIMINRYGVSKYMLETEAKQIDVDQLNLEGSSMRTLMEDKHKNRWLIGTDGSTGRVYHMSVPNNVNTCKEAHQAISGIDESNLIAEC